MRPRKGSRAPSLQSIFQWAPGSQRQNCRAPGLHCTLFRAPGAPSLKIRENHDRNCLGSKAQSFQNDGFQGSKEQRRTSQSRRYISVEHNIEKLIQNFLGETKRFLTSYEAPLRSDYMLYAPFGHLRPLKCTKIHCNFILQIARDTFLTIH